MAVGQLCWRAHVCVCCQSLWYWALPAFFFFPLHHLLRAVDRSQCGQPAQAVGSGRGEFSPEEPLPP